MGVEKVRGKGDKGGEGEGVIGGGEGEGRECVAELKRDAPCRGSRERKG